MGTDGKSNPATMHKWMNKILNSEESRPIRFFKYSFPHYLAQFKAIIKD